MSNEQELIARLKMGDPQAVRRWFKEYHARLVRFLNTQVSSSADAEELAQETFVNCLRHLSLFRGDAGLWTWMISIAKHEVGDYFRKKYAKKAIQALPLSELLEMHHVHDAHDSAELVAQAIGQLKVEWRELLQLKYVDNKSVKDIAEELGKSVKSVEAELFRARQAFKIAYLDVEAAGQH